MRSKGKMSKSKLPISEVGYQEIEIHHKRRYKKR